MSKDHVPTLPKETERIYKAGGKVIRGRVNGILSCSRAIGDIDLKKSLTYDLDQTIVTSFPDVRSKELNSNIDFLILACDGIWECENSNNVV